MEAHEPFRDIENLRFRVQMNNRLRLECLAAVSKVFREFGEPIADELLAGIVFALPKELVSNNGNGHAGNGSESVEAYSAKWQAGAPPDAPPEGPPKPGAPPDAPPEGPPKPGAPPDAPPEGPPKPGAPPDAPHKPASNRSY